MVEVAHGETGHECVNPQRQAGELDGHWVDIEPVYTATRDLAAQEAHLVNLALGDIVGAKRIPGHAR